VAQQRTHSSPETSAGAGAQVPGSGPIKTQASRPGTAWKPMNRGFSIGPHPWPDHCWQSRPTRHFVAMAPDLEPDCAQRPLGVAEEQACFRIRRAGHPRDCVAASRRRGELTTVFGPLVEARRKDRHSPGLRRLQAPIARNRRPQVLRRRVAGQAWTRPCGTAASGGRILHRSLEQRIARAVDWLRQFAGSL